MMNKLLLPNPMAGEEICGSLSLTGGTFLEKRRMPSSLSGFGLRFLHAEAPRPVLRSVCYGVVDLGHMVRVLR